MLGPVTNKFPSEAVLSASAETVRFEPRMAMDPLLVSTTADPEATSGAPTTVKVPDSLDKAVPDADNKVPVSDKVATRADAPAPSAEGPVPTTVKEPGRRALDVALDETLGPVTATLPTVAVDVASPAHVTEGPWTWTDPPTVSVSASPTQAIEEP
jgi:hypothetical protein